METEAAEQPKIRVAIVDDQQLVRSGFRMLIDSQDDLEVVFEAANGAEAVALVKETPADIILMDIRMPELNGIEATRKIVQMVGGGPRVIVLTTFNIDEYVLDALAAGASGFLLKDAEPEELLKAIRVVHSGDAVISPEMTRRLIERLGPNLANQAQSAASASGANTEVTANAEATANTELAAAAELLTGREREILVLMAEGFSNGEIAQHLVISVATVKTHVAHILKKTSSRDRVQAVIFAFESGIVGSS